MCFSADRLFNGQFPGFTTPYSSVNPPSGPRPVLTAVPAQSANRRIRRERWVTRCLRKLTREPSTTRGLLTRIWPTVPQSDRSNHSIALASPEKGDGLFISTARRAGAHDAGCRLSLPSDPDPSPRDTARCMLTCLSRTLISSAILERRAKDH